MPEHERKGMHYSFATIGGRTERGGRVTSGSGVKVCGLAVACVGDIVTYSDASEAVIIDGAGFAAVIEERSAAIVGSTLSNGDRIIETIWDELGIGVFIPEGEDVPGFLDAAWTPPRGEPAHRFAVHGATTARGGVLLEISSNFEVEGTHRRAGRIGDFIQYRDGTRTRIITGVGILGNTTQAFAVVGSMLENGDVITDSPHRQTRTLTAFVPVDAHGLAFAR